LAAASHNSPAALRARAEDARILGATRYWTPEIHAGAFNLPPYIADHLPG
jgi:spermidine synthase